MKNKVKYTEPTDYIPKSIRKELGLGEYAKKADSKKTTAKSGKKTGK